MRQYHELDTRLWTVFSESENTVKKYGPYEIKWSKVPYNGGYGSITMRNAWRIVSYIRKNYGSWSEFKWWDFPEKESLNKEILKERKIWKKNRAKELALKRQQSLEREASRKGCTIADIKRERGQERKKKLDHNKNIKNIEKTQKLIEVMPHVTELKDLISMIEDRAINNKPLKIRYSTNSIKKIKFMIRTFESWLK